MATYISYWIESLGRHPLPEDLCEADESNVEDIVRRAAAFIGRPDVHVERVTSVLGGSCIVCTDVVASEQGVPLIVARPAMY